MVVAPGWFIMLLRCGNYKENEFVSRTSYEYLLHFTDDCVLNATDFNTIKINS